MGRFRSIITAIYDHYLGGGKLWPFVLSLAAALVLSLAAFQPGLFGFAPSKADAAAAIDSGLTGLRSAPGIFFSRWTHCRYDWRLTCLDPDDFAEKIGVAATPVAGKDGCYMVARFAPVTVPPAPPAEAAGTPATPPPGLRPGSLADQMVRGVDIGKSDQLVRGPAPPTGILVRDPNDPNRLIRMERIAPEERCYPIAFGPWGVSWERTMADDYRISGVLVAIGFVLGLPDALSHTVQTLWNQSPWSVPIAGFAALLLLGFFVWDEFKPGRAPWSFGDALGAVVMLPIALVLVLWLIGAIYAGVTAVAGSEIAKVVWAPVTVFAANYKGAKKIVGGLFDWTRLLKKATKGS